MRNRNPKTARRYPTGIGAISPGEGGAGGGIHPGGGEGLLPEGSIGPSRGRLTKL